MEVDGAHAGAGGAGDSTAVESALIPTVGGDVIEIFEDELPDDVDELLTVLKTEYAPLEAWHRIAVRSFASYTRLCRTGR